MTTSKNKFNTTFLEVIILLIILALLGASCTSESHGVRCLDNERQALLEFRAGVDDIFFSDDGENRTDCCQWWGVSCDNRTNHVIVLDLSEYAALFIGGQGLNSNSLRNLSRLQVLNLCCMSDFSSNLDWLSSLESLEYLDLSFTDLREANTWLQAITNLPVVKEIHLRSSSLPQPALPSSLVHFVNASNSLSTLDLSSNYMNLASLFPWLLNYNSSLSHLDLSGNYIGEEIPDALNYLSSLSHLDLSHDALQGPIPDALGNLTNLSYLNLSHNRIDGSIPNTLGNLGNLYLLDLSYNHLEGEFPEFPYQFSSNLTFLDLSNNLLQGELAHVMMQLWESTTTLKYLDLSQNELFGSIPNMSKYPFLKDLRLNDNLLNGSIGQHDLKLPNLEFLDVSRNKLTGRVPNLSSCLSLRSLSLNDNLFNGSLTETIGNLVKLEDLNLGSNHLEGLFSEAHLLNLSNLQSLSLSFNSNLTIRINPLWNAPFQLSTLILVYCNVGPHFPTWIQNQTQIQYLDISNAKILDGIPGWFWNNTQMPSYLNMSHNQIHGHLPYWSSTLGLRSIDLSFNQFTGTLPPIPPGGNEINLSRNKISGTITNFCNFTSSFYGGSDLYAVDLSNNQLTGKLSPGCFKSLMSLYYLNLANNDLSGEILTDIGDCALSSLYLRNNSFSGYIPRSLMKCDDMIALDLGENNFYGNIPRWLGENMPHLVVLSLKSNKLNGSLPSTLCSLSAIQVLDISMNRISGVIPKCVNKFTMLSSKTNFSGSIMGWVKRENWTSLHDSAKITWKGQIAEYMNTLWLLKAIDLSSNNLSGGIPREITRLGELIALNLSRNNLVGSIPPDISQLKLLNFLDLSRNRLGGSIPSTISQLSHLGVLDLSFNNLSGKIPFDDHMDTFNASSYAGNSDLCGLPLISRPCLGDDEMPGNPKFSGSAHKLGHMWNGPDFYVSMVFGFIVSFWGAFGSLHFNKRWNVTVSKVFISVEDWLYVKILMNKRRLQSHFQH